MQSSTPLSRGIYAACIYFILGVADMGFSSAAFVLGIGEANPILAWLTAHGLFVPAKLLLTAFVAALIARTYCRDSLRPVIWGAVLVMALVDIYHIWGLTVL